MGGTPDPGGRPSLDGVWAGVAVRDGGGGGAPPILAVVVHGTVHEGEADTRVWWEGGGGGMADHSDEAAWCRTTEGVVVVEVDTVVGRGVWLHSLLVSNRVDRSSVCIGIR